MSRVITIQVDNCELCPSRLENWTGSKFESVCDRKQVVLTYFEQEQMFPTWCPLPESKEESK